MSQQSVRISFKNLSALKMEVNAKPMPLSSLDANCHIHGNLQFCIGEKQVPSMGYWSEDDVCFSDWIHEFEGIIKAFSGKENASYTFDEGEQGQAAYLFEKEGESVYLSIIDSVLTDMEGDPDWQRVEFGYSDFLEQYQEFKAQFLNQLYADAPRFAAQWVANFLVEVG
jgi:hypothetical protein